MDTLDPVYEAMSHLGAAIMQSVPEDDQLIMGHVRDAHALLSAAWRAQRKAERDAMHNTTMEMLRAAS